MFLNHHTAFDTFTPVDTTAPMDPSVTAAASTLFETPEGWQPLSTLRAGETVATLDGGYAEIMATQEAHTGPLIHIPGGTLSTCTPAILPATASVALDLPARVCATPVVSVPLVALCGWRGIRRLPAADETLHTLTFADEEMVYCQTGLRLHAHPGTDGFFERKTYGETRALLARVAGELQAPDHAAAA